MIRAFFSVSAIYAIGVPLALFVNIVLARWLTVEEFGAYSFAIAFATFIALPVSGGLTLLLTREIATSVEQAQPRRFNQLFATSIAWIVPASALVCAVVTGVVQGFVASPSLALSLAPLLVPGLAFVAMADGIAKGLGKPAIGEAVRQLVIPLLLLLGAAVLSWADALRAPTMLGVNIAAFSLVSLIALAVCLRLLRKPVRWGLVPGGELRGLAVSYVSFAMITGLGVLIAQFATLTLGVLGDEDQVAFLRVAERGSQLVLMPLTFVNAILGPKIVNAHARGDMTAIRALVRGATRLALAAALPVAGALIFAGEAIIVLTFGPQYSQGAYQPMVLLCLANLVFVGFGPAALILTMTGFEKDNVLACSLGFAILAALVVGLALDLGAWGAALGVAIGMVAIKLSATGFLWRRLRIFSGPF